MSDTPQVLLEHRLKTLKLPTFLREYEKVARRSAHEGLDHVEFLSRLVELELIDRERRLVERRIAVSATRRSESYPALGTATRPHRYPPFMRTSTQPLTLDRLSRRMGVPAKQLSAAINRTTGANVSRYVNGFRVEKACECLLSGEAVTAAMLSSGFNTRSNFNREFRRITGKSPRDWREAPGKCRSRPRAAPQG